ncbi:MAG: hypothetical protein V1743_03445 [Nanoarchaeota archaeon]
MRNDDVTIRCYKCGKEYSSREMKYMPGETRLVCVHCIAGKKTDQGARVKPLAKETPRKMPMQAGQKTPAIGKPKTDQLTHYFCSACKYNFTRKVGADILACPYCGKEGFISKKKDASTLLNESTERTYDW